MSENNSAPDSWEAAADDHVGTTLSPNFTTLNVNAPVFIPNVNAPEFVPSYMKDEIGQTTQPTAPGEIYVYSYILALSEQRTA